MAFTFRSLRFTVPAILALVAACGAADESSSSDEDVIKKKQDLRPELAQLNDVSILYPLPEDASAVTNLVAPDAPARGGALVPSTIYEQAFGAPGTRPGGMLAPPAPVLTSLHLVAVRFDPCFAAVGPVDDASCVNQVRLVFQHVTELGADDTAVHAFYALSRAELKSAVERVVAIRRVSGDDRLGPLAPHPRMKSEGLSGATASAINQLVKEIAGAANLTRLTLFTVNGMGQRWNFSGFDVAGGNATRMTIPHVPETAPHVSFFAGLITNDLTADIPFAPAPAGAKPEDDLQLLASGPKAAAPEVAAAQRQAAFDATVRIENPSLHSSESVDCASCHVAEPARRLVGEKKLGLSLKDKKSRFVADAKFVPAADTKLTSIDGANVNVHMFSYRGKVASIHPRTVNESAAVVAYLNAKVLGRP